MALTYLQETNDASNLTTYTFAAQNLGTASADRYIRVAIKARSSDGGARTLSSVTIGGVGATINVQAHTSGDSTAIAGASIPTGATGDIVVTWSGGMGDCNIGVWASTGDVSATATDSGSSTATPQTYSIDVVAGGYVIAVGSTSVGGTCTWTNVTEKWDEVDGGGNNWSGASDEFLTTQTNTAITATWTAYGRSVACFASFEVSAAAATHKNLTLLGVS